MRLRKSAAGGEADPHFGDLLQNLHKSSSGALHQDVGGDEGPPQTLGDVSKRSVGKLLDRVSVRRAVVKKRQFEEEKLVGSKRRKGRGKAYTEDDLLHQRPVSSASAPMCGALAKTSRDAESSHTTNISLTSEEPNESTRESGDPGNRSETNMLEDFEEGINMEDDEEFEWEQGKETYAGSTADAEGGKGNGWIGDITIQVENKAEKRNAAPRKPPARRANARDKEFAELVHKAHLLCLLGRGRMVDAACDDSLLQASLLSVLPPSISLLSSSGGSSAILLRSFVSWFSTTFQISTPESRVSNSGKQGTLSLRLLEVAQQQVGTAEEVTAISVAFLRSLGFTTRYVASLDAVPLKPDASSLEASAGWDPRLDGEGIVYAAHDNLEAERVTSLARLLAQCAFQRTESNGQPNGSNYQLMGSAVSSRIGPQKESGGDVVKSNSGAGKYNNAGQIGNSDRGKNVLPESTEDFKAEVKAYSRRKRRSVGSTNGSHEGSSTGDAHAEALDEQVRRRPSSNKGDEELETQVALAVCATAAAAREKTAKNNELSIKNSPLAIKRLNGIVAHRKKAEGKLATKVGISSRGESSSKSVPVNRMGAPLHWAEIYAVEDHNGRWVHVDAARSWFNGADKVEGAALAGRVPLRYVVAFAGSGAKDVTRRYVGMWSSVSALRVDEAWWASTLHPLKQLEAVATAGTTLRQIQSQNIPSSLQESREKQAVPEDHSVLDSVTQKRLLSKSDYRPVPSMQIEHDLPEVKRTGKRATRTQRTKRETKKAAATGSESAPHDPQDRSALEDMELETKTYTEPLPTSQQAYKSHHLYALERWLTKYQTLHPKGPVLGYCAGQPVYPRTCVQMLHTPDRWLREGLRVREGEIPAKVVKANHLSGKSIKQAAAEVDGDEEKPPPPTTGLFGKWQCDPWRPPRAVNGLVPKNERGQVDCWSEYCIPPGTVHLRFPRLVPIVKRLSIDFAPAMVGFEIRKRRSVPMYEGVVVCEEFKDVIMDAYKQEEEIRFGQLRRKREEIAIRRWRELLHSMATRERLKAAYEGFPRSNTENEKARNTPKKVTHSSKPPEIATKKNVAQKQEVAHVHHFPEENQSYNEETGTRTKVCPCGFTVHVEEM